jgi:hypothetical protein
MPDFLFLYDCFVCLSQERIVSSFFSDSGRRTVPVEYLRCIVQYQQLCFNRFYQCIIVAAGKVGSGMYAKVQVLLPVQQQQVVIPQTAVNFTLYGQTVYVVEDGKDAKGQPVKIAKQTVVNVAERDADVAHVVSGLKVGDVVVTSGQIRLSNGSQVKAVEDNTLAKPATVPAL